MFRVARVRSGAAAAAAIGAAAWAHIRATDAMAFTREMDARQREVDRVSRIAVGAAYEAAATAAKAAATATHAVISQLATQSLEFAAGSSVALSCVVSQPFAEVALYLTGIDGTVPSVKFTDPLKELSAEDLASTSVYEAPQSQLPLSHALHVLLIQAGAYQMPATAHNVSYDVPYMAESADLTHGVKLAVHAGKEDLVLDVAKAVGAAARRQAEALMWCGIEPPKPAQQEQKDSGTEVNSVFV